MYPALGERAGTSRVWFAVVQSLRRGKPVPNGWTRVPRSIVMGGYCAANVLTGRLVRSGCSPRPGRLWLPDLGKVVAYGVRWAGL